MYNQMCLVQSKNRTQEMIISEVKVNMNNLIKINKEKEREIDVFRKQLNVLNQRETQLEL